MSEVELDAVGPHDAGPVRAFAVVPFVYHDPANGHQLVISPEAPARAPASSPPWSSPARRSGATRRERL